MHNFLKQLNYSRFLLQGTGVTNHVVKVIFSYFKTKFRLYFLVIHIQIVICKFVQSNECLPRKYISRLTNSLFHLK